MKAFFLDRDGVLIDDSIPYMYRPEDVIVYPFVAEALKRIKAAGYEIFVVTNQPGISEGKIKASEVESVCGRIDEILLAEGAPVPRKYFYCPHMPKDHCSCRKPEPGLLLQAAEEFGIDLGKSFMIGDRISDMQAAEAAGCAKGVHILTGFGMNVKDDVLPEGYLRAENVAEAVKLLLSQPDNA